MMKYLLYALVFALVILVASLVTNSKNLDSISAIATVNVQSLVKKMENQVDEGELAIEYFNQEYKKATQKLIALKSLKLDAKANMELTKSRIDEYEKKSDLLLAEKNKEQYDFFSSQLNAYDDKILKREQRLQELSKLHSGAKMDVKLAREKINYFKALREALDEEDQQDKIESAQELINNLNKSCHHLRAEIDVLNLQD